MSVCLCVCTQALENLKFSHAIKFVKKYQLSISFVYHYVYLLQSSDFISSTDSVGLDEVCYICSVYNMLIHCID